MESDLRYHHTEGFDRQQSRGQDSSERRSTDELELSSQQQLRQAIQAVRSRAVLYGETVLRMKGAFGEKRAKFKEESANLTEMNDLSRSIERLAERTRGLIEAVNILEQREVSPTDEWLTSALQTFSPDIEK